MKISALTIRLDTLRSPIAAIFLGIIRMDGKDGKEKNEVKIRRQGRIGVKRLPYGGVVTRLISAILVDILSSFNSIKSSKYLVTSLIL